MLAPRLQLLLVSCLLAAASWHVHADPLRESLPVIEPMPGMDAQWAGERLVYNGVRMSIRNFATRLPAKEVLDHYERAWRTRGSDKISHSKVEEFDSIGFKTKKHFYSVRARDTQYGSEGSLVVSRALDEAESPGRETDFPIVPGSEIVSTIEALDRDTRAETVVSSNVRSVSANEIWFQNQLADDGWVEERLAQPLAGERRVITFQRGKQLCQITLIGDSPDYPNRTLVLVHWIKGGDAS